MLLDTYSTFIGKRFSVLFSAIFVFTSSGFCLRAKQRLVSQGETKKFTVSQMCATQSEVASQNKKTGGKKCRSNDILCIQGTMTSKNKQCVHFQELNKNLENSYHYE